VPERNKFKINIKYNGMIVKSLLIIVKRDNRILMGNVNGLIEI